MRALVLPALMAVGLAVTGCGSASYTANRGLESVHQPLVARSDYAIDVRASDDGLDAGEGRRLAGWFDTLKIGYGDRITVDVGANGTPAARDAIARVAAGYGLLLGETAPVTVGEIPAGAVRVVISRSTAFVPGCPDWSGSSSPYFDGATDTNYGCATNANLAAMIADPQDLIAGRRGSASLSTRAATRALKAYNEIIPTGVVPTLKTESTGGQR